MSLGVSELDSGQAPLGRVRRPGGGRKRVVDVNPGLRPALLALVEPDMRGDPMSPLRWTTKSTRNLAAELTRQGYRVSADLVGDVLREEGADSSSDPLETKVRRNKPLQAKDTCWVAGQAGVCGDGLPSHSSPRMVAGGPLANDILKCQLKPIDWSDYGSIQFTESQKKLLRAAFSDGVCDWSKPGIEQQPAAGVWQTFMDTVGGRPLGPAPESLPITGN